VWYIPLEDKSCVLESIYKNTVCSVKYLREVFFQELFLLSFDVARMEEEPFNIT
jgi:hypothetical protein